MLVCCLAPPHRGVGVGLSLRRQALSAVCGLASSATIAVSHCAGRSCLYDGWNCWYVVFGIVVWHKLIKSCCNVDVMRSARPGQIFRKSWGARHFGRYGAVWKLVEIRFGNLGKKNFWLTEIWRCIAPARRGSPWHGMERVRLKAKGFKRRLFLLRNNP